MLPRSDTMDRLKNPPAKTDGNPPLLAAIRRLRRNGPHPNCVRPYLGFNIF